ncbi:MAG: hypothetical protein IBX55_17690 [Methyloprofundus sp.]|nr:hypothetical protein [Methyloprofundus sp.]
MIDFILNFWNNFINHITGFYDDFIEFMTDLPLIILEKILIAFSSVINAIPVPALFSNGLGALVGSLDSSILYFLSVTGFAEALSLLGVGISFRLIRKVVTLGQW